MSLKETCITVRRIAVIFICILLLGGCARSPYRYGHPNINSEKAPTLEPSGQFVHGKPHPLLDASDWIWPGSLLTKLIVWDRDIDSHEISEQTVATTRKYLRQNGLDDVLVLVNAYQPGSQWSRLFSNREMGAAWRYTLGVFNVLSYTFFPGRIIGGDHYNPYTNTINLFSDEVAIALHEAAHAKDFNRRRFKGFHAAIYNLPGAPLYYESIATSDALSYLQEECRPRDLQHAYRLLHPAYGTYLGSTFIAGPALYAVALPAHISGSIAARKVQRREKISPCVKPSTDSSVNGDGSPVTPRINGFIPAKVQNCVAQ